VKKFPKEWIIKMRDLIRLSVYSKVDFAADKFLSELDAAGMLKDIPEPLEIEYCVAHGYVGKRRDGNCVDMELYPFSENRCNFKKMREVEE